jgi:TolB-like protein
MSFPHRLAFIAFFLACSLLASGCSRTVPRRVAVLNFENATGDERLNYLENALPEYLIASLSNGQESVMLERQMPRLATGKPAEKAPRHAKEWLARNARRANYFIAGSISRLERNYILTARLCNAKTSEILTGSAVTEACISEQQIYNRMLTIAQKLAVQLKNNGVETPLYLNPTGAIPPQSEEALSQTDAPETERDTQ